MKVLLTGANGFVGRPLCEALIKSNVDACALVRHSLEGVQDIEVVIKELSSEVDLRAVLKGVDVVIHLAGRAHVMKESSADPYRAYYEANVGITKVLATQAAASGVKRLIFLSSIKVNGEITGSQPFSETDTPQPEDDYGKTKYEAEQVLSNIAKNSAMEFVIIRPPLVYGSGVKANFKKLIKLSQLPIPLPLGAIHNKRSLIYIGNLVDFIITCLDHTGAANQIFLISDGEDVSTTQLIKLIKRAANQKALLLPMPKKWLAFTFRLLDKSPLFNRLCGNLQVDISKAITMLNWQPPYDIEQGINKTVSECD